MFTRRATFERILKNVEADGRTSADVQTFHSKEEQKKVIPSADVRVFTDIQRVALEERGKIIFGFIHVRSLNFCKCPRAAQNGLTGRTLPTPANRQMPKLNLKLTS